MSALDLANSASFTQPLREKYVLQSNEFFYLFAYLAKLRPLPHNTCPAVPHPVREQRRELFTNFLPEVYK